MSTAAENIDQLIDVVEGMLTTDVATALRTHALRLEAEAAQYRAAADAMEKQPPQFALTTASTLEDQYVKWAREHGGNGGFRSSEFYDALGLTKYHGESKLKALLDAGVVQRIGKRQTTRYIVA